VIDFLNLRRINCDQHAAAREAIERVLDSGWYILGHRVRRLRERVRASSAAPRHAVGVANGLDALSLSLRAWASARATR
jgi:dTDP-4-amino-4,6-dideoxygalactose transaminase